MMAVLWGTPGLVMHLSSKTAPTSSGIRVVPRVHSLICPPKNPHHLESVPRFTAPGQIGTCACPRFDLCDPFSVSQHWPVCATAFLQIAIFRSKRVIMDGLKA